MKNLLSTSTIKKIFREHFQGEEPIFKDGLSEQKIFISHIKQKFEITEGIKLLKISRYNHIYRQDGKEEMCCYFKVLSISQYYSGQEFYLKFNEKNELCIMVSRWFYTPVYHLKQIDTFVDKMVQEYKRLEINYLKRENKKLKDAKIKDIKYKAIQAKIHEIAKEDKLKIAVKRCNQQVELFICLGKAEEMKIHIPYDKFHETLKSLRTAIQTIMNLRHSGLKFQIHSYIPRYYDEPEWTTYD